MQFYLAVLDDKVKQKASGRSETAPYFILLLHVGAGWVVATFLLQTFSSGATIAPEEHNVHPCYRGAAPLEKMNLQICMKSIT